MKTVTIRDMRSRPREVQQTLAAGSEALLTSNGRPVAIMIPVEAESLEETLAMLHRARGLQTLAAIRRYAAEKGTDRMSMDEIDAEIRTARRERRERMRATGRG